MYTMLLLSDIDGNFVDDRQKYGVKYCDGLAKH